jgi:hypothetical protein
MPPRLASCPRGREDLSAYNRTPPQHACELLHLQVPHTTRSLPSVTLLALTSLPQSTPSPALLPTCSSLLAPRTSSAELSLISFPSISSHPIHFAPYRPRAAPLISMHVRPFVAIRNTANRPSSTVTGLSVASSTPLGTHPPQLHLHCDVRSCAARLRPS